MDITGEHFLYLLMLHILAKRLSQSEVLRFSTAVQQKAHRVPANGFTGARF